MIKSKLKFCAFRTLLRKWKRQPAEWGKPFANNLSGKGLASPINIGLLQLSNKDKQCNWKWAKNLSRQFSGENTNRQQAHKDMSNLYGNTNPKHSERINK